MFSRLMSGCDCFNRCGMFVPNCFVLEDMEIGKKTTV